MRQPTQIHGNKPTFRRHFLDEWLKERGMKPMDLVHALNEADTSLPPIDKSQVYRWLKGQLPHMPTQVRIAAALELLDPVTNEPDPQMLLRHPHQDWIARKLQGRSEEELDRARKAIELVLPDRTGTDD